MFKQEMFGYAKEDVDQYLVETLKRLESFEHTIESQKNEIKSLEKRIEVLQNSDTSNLKKSDSNIVEQALVDADQLIIDTLMDIHSLQERIRDVIKQELEK